MTTPDRSRIMDLSRRLDGEAERWRTCPVTLGRTSLDGYELRCSGLAGHAGDMHFDGFRGVFWEHHIVKPRMIDLVPEGRYG